MADPVVHIHGDATIVRPGDKLILQFHGISFPEQLERARAIIQNRFVDTPVLVLDDRLEITIIRASDDASAA